MKRQKTAVLAGDIGGTKANLAIFSSELIPGAPLAEASYWSRDFGSLEELVLEFLSRVGAKVDLASFGVAGPVVNGQARTTNLPWVLDEAALADALGVSSVHLLNDLPALQRRPFMQAFRRKGRMWRFMDAIPVHAILNPRTALLGAACHGLTAAQSDGADTVWRGRQQESTKGKRS